MTQSSPPAPGRSRHLGYQPALDGMRGVAVSLVVLIHTVGWPRGGYLGVDIFFALSGFLITVLLLQEWEAHADISLKAFYLRRVFRLVPALVVTVAVYLVIVTVNAFMGNQVGFSGAESNNVIGALLGPLYVQNIAVAWDLPWQGELTHLWSLATEEQFYLLWPLSILMLLRAGMSRTSVRRLLVALVVAIFCWRWIAVSIGVSARHLFFGPDMRFDSILVGCIAGMTFGSPARRRLQARSMRRLAMVACVILALPIVLSPDGHDLSSLGYLYRGWFTLIAVAATIIVVACVEDPAAPLTRLLSNRHLVFLGRLSYSLYLWHVLVIYVVIRAATVAFGPGWGEGNLLLAVIEIPLSIAAAYASYRYVELPFLRRKRKYEVRGRGQAVPEIHAV